MKTRSEPRSGKRGDVVAKSNYFGPYESKHSPPKTAPTAAKRTRGQISAGSRKRGRTSARRSARLGMPGPGRTKPGRGWARDGPPPGKPVLPGSITSGKPTPLFLPGRPGMARQEGPRSNGSPTVILRRYMGQPLARLQGTAVAVPGTRGTLPVSVQLDVLFSSHPYLLPQGEHPDDLTRLHP